MYYFASDVHLGSGDGATARRTEQLFTSWLDDASRDAEAIFLLGDVFDFWYEYRRVVPKGYVRTLAKLADLTQRGIRVVMLTGNHDMWVREYLNTECGVELHTKPLIESIAGRKIYLAHGDNMKIEGKPMLKLMNCAFRSNTLRFLFSHLVHPDLAMGFGRWWSSRSRKSHGEGPQDKTMLDPLTEYAAELGREQGVECCIFGHLHLPDERMADKTRVIFLGDWSDVPTYAAMTPEGDITLKRIENR
ncbi:MAG: UDP-2,3-diacylglucosamine diphosphatase [Alistipes sp.]|nr:UDP-2,3-diacylglucosamine diphosphatase [Alistipes sp.]